MLQGYVIVYDVTNKSSFDCMDKLKKQIEKEKNKEKKEVRYRDRNRKKIGNMHKVSE